MSNSLPFVPTHFAHAAFAGWIGAAQADITPPVGSYARNWGAAAHDTAEGVHRPLTASALTLQTGSDTAPLILLSLDLGWWRSYRDEWYVRQFVLDALTLDPARLLIHFTHTHAGPVLCRDDAGKPGGALITPYLDSLRNALVSVTRSALASAVPATLDWRYGTCDLATNRDLPDPNGSRFVCGFNPSAPADNTLLVGRVTAQTGQPVATLINYACHPTTLGASNRLLSPDWVGAMRETIQSQTGPVPCLFLQGASGELAPREQYAADTALADAQGRQIGFAVLATLAGMLPPRTRLAYAGVSESGAPLALWERQEFAPLSCLDAIELSAELPLKPQPTLVELDAQIAACTSRVQAERLRRARRIREGIGDGATTLMPVWAWRIGDACLIAHPNEAYSALQTQLRQHFPHSAIAVCNVTNGHFGYLPPADLYDHDIYAVWQSPFDRGCLERLSAVCVQMVSKIMTEGR